jgi:hypothetical protein
MAERRSLAQMATQPLSLSARRASSPASRARSLDGQSTLRPPGGAPRWRAVNPAVFSRSPLASRKADGNNAAFQRTSFMNIEL